MLWSKSMLEVMRGCGGKWYWVVLEKLAMTNSNYRDGYWIFKRGKKTKSVYGGIHPYYCGMRRKERRAPRWGL